MTHLDNMKATFTFNGTVFIATKTNYFFKQEEIDGKTKQTRISKAVYEEAEREYDAYVEQKQKDMLSTATYEEQEDVNEEPFIIDINELAERTPEEVEDMTLNKNLSGEDLNKPAKINSYGCVNCSGCDVKNCVHRDCMRRNPISEGGLALCPRLNVKETKEAENPEITLEQFVEQFGEMDEQANKPKKAKKSKKKAFYTWANGGITFTLTERQVDFIKHLPDTFFWENGVNSEIWVDCLCDDIGGQFAGKPMTVGAMISTICEKGLGQRATERRDGKKCVSFALTAWGKAVARDLGLE